MSQGRCTNEAKSGEVEINVNVIFERTSENDKDVEYLPVLFNIFLEKIMQKTLTHQRTLALMTTALPAAIR